MEGKRRNLLPTVDEVFKDFRGRRAGLIKALTIDFDKFFQQCDPEKENLCLYGLPNESWEVNLPVAEVPPELPEPALGINFARDGMQEKDWLSLVAVHSDSWLLAVAFYFGGRFGFGKNERKRLFEMINELSTISEVLINQPRDESGAHSSSSENKFSGKSCLTESRRKGVQMSAPKEEEIGEREEEDDEQGATLMPLKVSIKGTKIEGLTFQPCQLILVPMGFETNSQKYYSESEIWQELENLEMDEDFQFEAYETLSKDASLARCFFGLPSDKRMAWLLKKSIISNSTSVTRY
ncbi:PHD finger protein Alfin1 [Ancistrocladus abbreviatus]